MTKIKKCNCKHSWQDKRYGKGRRVFNKMATGESRYRCTVCKAER